MKPRVYIETTVISYLTARPARDVVIAGHQQSTRDWWATASERFELVISELVREEAGAGDPDAVRARLTLLASLALLDATAEAQELAERLVSASAVPEAAMRDAAHIAIAAANGIEYLVTWNFRHIANAVTRPQIESVCRQAGFESPVICTPEELMENIDDEK
ncbi:MAG: type II toxin-antitoxin system VapC family toxin [Gemmatimonadetes bacterium]|nr:type II toxin-antitoxin system VapC family toxin [Gemmatimonadota bacterium]MYC74028.1 type II toxin-antitoxin system VapC family toxin [Gemmatimonadota bacterium]MYI61857.1 type II toxin-antitoxin system VapC family toxin [Gemmatimonadota bacterium]